MDKIKLYSNKANKNADSDGRRRAAPKPQAAPNRPPAPKPVPPPKAKKPGGGGKKAVAAVCILLALVFLGLGALGLLANSGDEIYSKVSMEGVSLSGLSAARAADKLMANGIGTQADETLEVSLPAGVEFTVSAKQAGAYYTAAEAAQFAYDYCYGGSFFSNTVRYLKTLLFGAKLNFADIGGLDETYLHAMISEGVNASKLALMASSVQIGEESITVIKGGDAITVDPDEVYELVAKALESGDFSPIKYSAAASEAAQVEKLDLQELYDTVFQEPENAKYDPASMQATEHVMGRSFDLDEAQRLWDAAANGDSIEIPLILTEPEVTQERLAALLFADLLSQKSTSLAGSSAARINNITKAAAAINGYVMNPGDEFSFNGVVGQRTAAGGYQAAGAYNNGQVVSEVGGGICQVSSTLYYCSLIANLEITNRLNHMFAVTYLPPGLDATVSWPGPDFKFKNNSEYPIKIAAWVDKTKNVVTVQIYGSNPEGIRVEMTYDSWNNPDGTGAVTYRSVFDRDGNLISRKEEARSRYTFPQKESPSPSPSLSPSPSPSPSPAPSPSPSPAPSPSPSAPPTTPPPATPPTPPPTAEPTPAPPPPTAPVEGGAAA